MEQLETRFQELLVNDNTPLEDCDHDNENLEETFPNTNDIGVKNEETNKIDCTIYSEEEMDDNMFPEGKSDRTIEKRKLMDSDSVESIKKKQQRWMRILMNPSSSTGNSENIITIQKDVSQLEMEGFLFKKQNQTNKWSHYYFHFSPDSLQLDYYKSKEDYFKGKSFRRSISVTWIYAILIKDEDDLLRSQLKMNRQANSGTMTVCKYRLRVFSPQRIFTLCSDTDDELRKWAVTINEAISACFHPQELIEKRRASKKIEPLFRKQFKIQMEIYLSVVNALQKSGIITLECEEKEKEGHLELEKQQGVWKRYYFILFSYSLSYFNPENKVIPSGVISLKSILSVSPDNEQSTLCETSRDNEENQCRRFKIFTLIRCFHLQAKHHSAMLDWIMVLQSHKKTALSPAIQRDNEMDGIQIQKKDKIIIEYNQEGRKTKLYKMKKSSIIIGRSSEADLSLKDPKVSRNHCRIELNLNSVPVLYDLGSSLGSSVNGKKVTKIALKSGDQIDLGETHLYFKVMQKKPNGICLPD